MVAWLKGIYRANVIASFIFFVGGIRHRYNLSRGEPLMAPVIANATLYCTDSTLFENDA